MVRRLAVCGTVLGALSLALPGAAAAGGFATVGLSSLPDGTAPGAAWNVRLTILRHGRTPLDELRPVIRLRREGGGATREVVAVPAGPPGVYRARVVFPSAGRWRYEVRDGFSLTHQFAPVRIGGPGPAAAPAPDPPARRGDVGAALAAALAAGVAAAALTAAAAARRRPAPTPAAAPR